MAPTCGSRAARLCCDALKIGWRGGDYTQRFGMRKRFQQFLLPVFNELSHQNAEGWA
jgi:hypothetical protein